MDARNSIIITFAFLLVAGSALPALADPVLTYQADFNSPIPANLDDSKGWMDDAVIDIPDHFTVLDIDVGINVTHTSAFDLQVFLQSPAGTNLCLVMYNFDEFFEGADYAGTIFDDEAPIPIDQGQPPFTGRFKPRAPNLLDIFDGEDTFGQWRLRIYDARYYDTGRLESFKLFIAVPEPASLSIFAFAAGLLLLRKPRADR